LAEDRRDLIAVFGERALHLITAVPGRDHDVFMWKLPLRNWYRSTTRITLAFGSGRMITDESLITPAVIVPLELQILGSPRHRASQSKCQKHDLCAAVSPADEFAARNNLRQQFRDFILEFMLRAKGQG